MLLVLIFGLYVLNFYSIFFLLFFLFSNFWVYFRMKEFRDVNLCLDFVSCWCGVSGVFVDSSLYFIYGYIILNYNVLLLIFIYNEYYEYKIRIMFFI